MADMVVADVHRVTESKLSIGGDIDDDSSRHHVDIINVPTTPVCHESGLETTREETKDVMEHNFGIVHLVGSNTRDGQHQGAMKHAVTNLLEDGAMSHVVNNLLEDGAMKHAVTNLIEDGAMKHDVTNMIEDGAMKHAVTNLIEDGAMSHAVTNLIEDGAMKHAVTNLLEEGAISHAVKNLTKDSELANGTRANQEFIGLNKINRDEPWQMSSRINVTVTDKFMATNNEGESGCDGGQNTPLNSATGGDQAGSVESTRSVQRRSPQTFPEVSPLNDGDVRVYEHSAVHSGPGRGGLGVLEKLASSADQSNDRSPDTSAPPSREDPFLGHESTHWVVTDALINVRGASSENKNQLVRNTSSLNSIQITRMKVMPRPPSRAGNREVNDTRKRTQNVDYHGTERGPTNKIDKGISHNDNKMNGPEAAETSSAQEAAAMPMLGQRSGLDHNKIDSQLLDNKVNNGNQGHSLNVSGVRAMSSSQVAALLANKTPRPAVNSSIRVKQNQVSSTIIRSTAGVSNSFWGSNKPRPKSCCSRSKDGATRFNPRHLSPTALAINKDVYNAFARVTPPRRPLSRQNSFPGAGQHKAFITVYDRPFSRRELRQALPRKSFFSCHDKALKDAGFVATDTPASSKPSRMRTQPGPPARESVQSSPKYPDPQPENNNRRVSAVLGGTRSRTPSERSNDADYPNDVPPMPDTEGENVFSDEDRGVFQLRGSPGGFRTLTPKTKKRKPQSAQSDAVDCTPLTQYLQYVKENHEEFLRYREGLKQESIADARLIKLGQVYELRHRGGVAREDCDDVVALAARTLRPRSEKLGQTEPAVRSAGSYRKPSRLYLDAGRPGEKTAAKADEPGRSELERRKVKAEEWAWSIPTHKLAQAKLQSLRELGSDDRELTAWWEVMRDCQYLRNVCR